MYLQIPNTDMQNLHVPIQIWGYINERKDPKKMFGTVNFLILIIQILRPIVLKK